MEIQGNKLENNLLSCGFTIAHSLWFQKRSGKKEEEGRKKKPWQMIVFQHFQTKTWRKT